MRKFLATLLALTVVLSLGVSAFADGSTAGSENITNVTSGNEKEITVSISADVTETAPTYYVTIAWENMVFTYTGSQATGWNTGTHKYDTAATGTWSGGGSGASSAITITNHSDVKVNAEAAYSTDNQYNNGVANPANNITVTVAGTCLNSETELEEGTETNASVPGDNQTGLTVTVSGTPTEDVAAVDAGTITVTISAASA